MKKIKESAPDLIVLNYANPDMVGHTGDFDAAVKAVEAVDDNLSRLIPLGLQHGYRILVIADHGNADVMVNEDGTPNTAHTTNPVPVILVANDQHPEIKDGILANVAPTLLKMMNLDIPVHMDKPLY